MGLTRPKYSSIQDTDWKQSCRAATTGTNITLSGGAPLTVDGVSLIASNRILVKDQTDKKTNGIYVVSNAGTGSNGTWTRAPDANTSDKLTSGVIVSITEGTTLAGQSYKLITPDPITLGTTELVFSAWGAGGGSAGGTTGQLQYNSLNSFAGAFGITTSTGYELTVTSGIQNTPIGNTTANSGAFTTLTTIGDATIGGNLVVSGATLTINSTTLTVNDKNIVVANNQSTSANIDGAGIDAGGITPVATWRYNHSTTSWQSNVGLTPSTNNTLALGGASNYWNNLYATTHYGTTGIFTGTVSAATVNAATIGNSGASLVGGLSNTLTFNNGGSGAASASTYNGSSAVTISHNTIGAAPQAGNTSIVTVGNITSGTWSATDVGLAHGGTNATLVASAGAVAFSNATAISLTAVGVSNQVLLSGGTGTPTWANQSTLSVGSATNQSGGTVDATTGAFSTSVTRNSRNIPTYVATASAPSSPLQGDFWYETGTDILYQYINDGTSSTWVDVSSALVNSATTATANTLALRDASADLYATVFRGKATSAQYADLAENYAADADYSPGTVVVFGGPKEITISQRDHDSRVAGVISTNPAYLMNSDFEGLPVAFTGRVPCKVQGPVRKGDVLVTSDTPGVAQTINKDKYVPGCVIGKALEDYNDFNIATIEVVVGRF